MSILNFFKPSYCDSCENPYPNHALIGIHGEHHCVKCIQTIDKQMYWCDGCGEDYPLHHLIHDESFDGYFCKRCSI